MAEPKETVHGGDIYRNPSVTDYSVNSNPLGVPEAAERAYRKVQTGSCIIRCQMRQTSGVDQ
ncbi:MAG: hypothetical protein ACLS4P_05045 [Dorea sp.]